jgi:hypothetical protein
MAQNFQLQLASEFVQYTDKNVFLTGKAGTGKTTFLHRLKENCPKRMVIVAPTGVAAINAGGSTIHSFFQLAFGPYVPNADQKSFQHKMNKQKISLIKSLDLLVIDEISMVRADTLDNIDEVLRRYRDRNKPFGGVQLLMIGDLHQLSPVVKDQDWELLKPYYSNLYFFNSRALQQTSPISIELKHIYRQSDTFFIDILNAVRENRIDEQVLAQLNQRYIPNFNPDEEEGYITLTSHNQSANIINDEKLKGLKAKSYHYKADVKGEFPEFSYPNALELELKEGAQVMFVKNDASRDKLYFNGKIGKIIKIKDDYIHVKCPGDLQEIVVGRVEWENTKYELNPDTKEIEEKVIGSFIQYPIKLAWAITIHKSQGLTFEKAIIDANAAFAHGQVYVALSRCKSFEGMVLRTPISFNSIKTDGTVATYTKNAEQNSPGEQHLVEAKVVFQRNLLLELFDFKRLKSSLYVCKKLAEEYHQIISLGFLENINAVREAAEIDIYTVVEKFNRQIEQYLQQGKLPEENEELQERVKKACTYFADKLIVLHENLDKVSFDADNKTIKKQFLEAIEQVEKEVFIKQSALKLCCNGFQTLNYLKTKANAEIDFLNLKKATPVEKATAPVTGVNHPELYKTIKTWRDQLAAENNVPVYHILPQKVLIELVNKLPSNFQELESIKGIGKTKVKQFGNELLVMISEYCEKKEVSQTPFQLFVKTTAEKVDTKKLSFDLFKAGKTMQEIALERNLALTTIETHLTHYIGTGDLDIYSFVNKSKVSQIQDYIWRNKPSSMNDTKAALGEEISYGEIRAVMKFMELNNS